MDTDSLQSLSAAGSSDKRSVVSFGSLRRKKTLQRHRVRFQRRPSEGLGSCYYLPNTNDSSQRRRLDSSETNTTTDSVVSHHLDQRAPVHADARPQALRSNKQTRRGMGVSFTIREAGQLVCQCARESTKVYTTSQPSQVHLVFFTSPSACAIYVCTTSALVLGEPILLYGILIVLSLQIIWIVLKWILYIADDPELRHLQTFCKGWTTVLRKEGSRIISGKSPPALFLAGTAARQLPTGMGMARVFLRKFTKRCNDQLCEELGVHAGRHAGEERTSDT